MNNNNKLTSLTFKYFKLQKLLRLISLEVKRLKVFPTLR